MAHTPFKVMAVVAASATALVGCGAAEEVAGGSSGDAEFSFTDITGRDVELDKAPDRVILGEGRSIFATGVLNTDNPLDKVVGIGTDLKQNVPDYYNALEKELPSVNEVPEIGGFTKGDVTVEKLVSLDPDLIVLSLDQYDASREAGLTDKMEQAGLKYAVTDFRRDPLENTPKTMDIFGEIFGQEDRAEEFNADWQKTVDLVEERAEKVKDKPRTFVWRAAGVSDCCGSWNDSNISQLVNAAGGENIADEIIPGESGTITPEKVLEADPDMIIATGGDWSEMKDDEGHPVGYAAVGYGIDEKEAKGSVAKLPGKQAGFDKLRAVKEHHFHSMWHQFYDSPFNYLALLQVAEWVDPEAYADTDVAKQWMDAQEKYSPVSGEGTFFSTN
ncbi:ABC transporter substrate-binding protein [Corynebacterium tuberculostearicum]|uniref:ABC transporter substrate-binding protein n=1 Tax=Corynebacterium tuberculostearicum TaxID=38304 RepID=UPI00264BC288|nr:ABC transporter substrate-binding protein [Corynebacterium tuberculostearicum]MDN8595888.1 ABC transporter substrate-binding protein [Corynebacterium tuberculostearicum]